jgi:ubiquinone/menaquinone biosynthesis C-methylase UbiE
MLKVGQGNIANAGLSERLKLKLADAKRLPSPDDFFGAVMSNSIVHHIPEPSAVVAEMIRVLRPSGRIFVRDLLRPPDMETLNSLVNQYAAGANNHQRTMFADSLRAALTLGEIRALVAAVGMDPGQVRPTSDRHWTWSAVKAVQ